MRRPEAGRWLLVGAALWLPCATAWAMHPGPAAVVGAVCTGAGAFTASSVSCSRYGHTNNVCLWRWGGRRGVLGLVLKAREVCLKTCGAMLVRSVHASGMVYYTRLYKIIPT